MAFCGLGKKTSGPGRRPVFLNIRSSRWFILTTVSLAVFSDIFLYGVIIPVMPYALIDRLHVHHKDVQHYNSILMAVYGAGLLVTAPLFGWLADNTRTRRSPLLFGLIVLTGSTVLIAVGTSMTMYVVGRLLQGVSGAMVWTVGLALLVDTIGAEHLGQAMGMVTVAVAMGTLVAPILGGVVYEKGGYYAVFEMSSGLILVDIFFRFVMIEQTTAQQWLPQSPPAETQVEQLQVTTVDEKGHPKPVTPTQHTESIPASTTSPPPKRRIRLPPFVTLLKSPRLLIALWGCMVQAGLMTSFDADLPIFVHLHFGWTSTGGGLIFLALFLPTWVAPIIGLVADRFGPRWLATAGFVLAAPCLVLLRLVYYHSTGQIVLLCALLALIGLTLTLVLTPLMAEITHIVMDIEKENPENFDATGVLAQAYGLFICAFAGGTLVGPLWAGFVTKKAGWATTWWTLGLFSILTAIPAALFTGGWLFKRKSTSTEQV